MTRWWVRWYEPVADDGDWRPLKVPPTSDVPGYWCSGWLGDGSAAVICAVVEAADAKAAKAIVTTYWHPLEWSFCSDKGPGWMPGGDRFPPSPTIDDAAKRAGKVAR